MRIKWRIFAQTGADMYIMVSEKNGKSVYMPLYVHTFRLNTACTYAETIKFREICKKPEALTETADKLRFLRHKLGWYQSEVASCIGISRSLSKEETQAFQYKVLVEVTSPDMSSVMELVTEEYENNPNGMFTSEKDINDFLMSSTTAAIKKSTKTITNKVHITAVKTDGKWIAVETGELTEAISSF